MARIASKRSRRIRLEGVAGGAEYVIGVPDPFTRRRRSRLGKNHLRALHVLLSFVAVGRLEEEFSVSKSSYEERFSGKNGWGTALELLDSWYRIRSSGYRVEGTVAETTVLTIGGHTELRVRLGGPLIRAFNLLLYGRRPQTGDSKSLAKTLFDEALSKFNPLAPDSAIREWNVHQARPNQNNGDDGSRPPAGYGSHAGLKL